MLKEQTQILTDAEVDHITEAAFRKICLMRSTLREEVWLSIYLEQSDAIKKRIKPVAVKRAQDHFNSLKDMSNETYEDRTVFDTVVLHGSTIHYKDPSEKDQSHVFYFDIAANYDARHKEPLHSIERHSSPTLTMSRLSSQFYTHEDVIMANLDSLEPLGEKFGQQLAKLHGLEPERFREDKRQTVLQAMLSQTRTFDVHENGGRRWFYNALEQRVREAETRVRPVFCHGDFNFSNVGFNEETGEPESLIDFAYSGYGMPETDFIYLQEPGLLESAVDAYKEVTGRTISQERLKLVSLVNNLRAMVSFEHYLAQDLSDDDREFYEAERAHCHDDILEACQVLGIPNFVFKDGGSPAFQF